LLVTGASNASFSVVPAAYRSIEASARPTTAARETLPPAAVVSAAPASTSGGAVNRFGTRTRAA
jgi:hypothetical protein